MDPRVQVYMNALGQRGGGGSIPVFRGAYRYQYGQGFGDVLRGIWRSFFPVVVRGAQSFFNAGATTLKKGGTVGEVLKSGIRPALGAVVKSAGKEIARRIAESPPEAAPPPGPQPRHPDERDVGTEAAPQQEQAGSGRRRKATSKRKSSKVYKQTKRPRFTNIPAYAPSPSGPTYYNF